MLTDFDKCLAYLLTGFDLTYLDKEREDSMSNVTALFAIYRVVTPPDNPILRVLVGLKEDGSLDHRCRYTKMAGEERWKPVDGTVAPVEDLPADLFVAPVISELGEMTQGKFGYDGWSRRILKEAAISVH